jgi:hypothetical protein
MITSSVTEAAILKLIEDGKVTWQDSQLIGNVSIGGEDPMLYLCVTLFDAEENCSFEELCAVDVANKYLYVV